MRTELISQLAKGWRNAENRFLETGSDEGKWDMKALTDQVNLTKKERKELDITNQMNGV